MVDVRYWHKADMLNALTNVQTHCKCDCGAARRDLPPVVGMLADMPGMTANLRIETDAREGVSRVPNAALRWHPPGATAADDHGQHVYVLDQGAPPAVPVKLGVTDGNVTEIVSGLDRREVIIGRAEHADRSR
jgi:hypothetical protein